MNSHATLDTLFAHNDFARDKLFAVASRLGDEALDRGFEIGPGSLRATLHHVWGAERVWLCRWKGEDLAAHMPTLQDKRIAIDALWRHFRETAAERNAYLNSPDAADPQRTLRITNMRGEAYMQRLGDMLLHVCNHGVHHRAQALNMLRHVGADVPWLDYLAMLRDSPSTTPAAFDLATIRDYFTYGDWARERVESLAAGLSDEQLDRPFEMGEGNLRQTLLHIRFGEQWWLENWTSAARLPFPETDPRTPLAELSKLWDQTIQGRQAFMAGLKDADLMKPVEAWPKPDVKRVFPLGATMLQICCHGTHHRAQAVNMLRRLGVAPPEVDYIVRVRKPA